MNAFEKRSIRLCFQSLTLNQIIIGNFENNSGRKSIHLRSASHSEVTASSSVQPVTRNNQLFLCYSIGYLNRLTQNDGGASHGMELVYTEKQRAE
ncbi:hypothetical protein [Paenibacillus sp. MMO-58]|uniref:hypothetical protein n=1 Tax=Paenibacillus sp. MMO-58 TaxID=3081290 RepID=UPI003016B524